MAGVSAQPWRKHSRDGLLHGTPLAADLAVRANRLAVLQQILRDFSETVNLSEVVVEGASLAKRL